MTKFNNERDAEVPFLLAVAKRVKPSTLLDVGANYTHYYYAKELKKLVGKYVAVDKLFCDETAKVVDEYRVGTLSSLGTKDKYDLVTCISVLEHVGIEEKSAAARLLARKDFFLNLLDLATKEVLVTFPYGDEFLLEDSYENITSLELTDLIGLAKKKGFSSVWSYYATTSDSTDQEMIWKNVDEKHVPFDKNKGSIHCVCMLSLIKDEIVQKPEVKPVPEELLETVVALTSEEKPAPKRRGRKPKKVVTKDE